MAPTNFTTLITSNPSSTNPAQPFSLSLPATLSNPGPQTTSNHANPRKRLHSSLTDADSDSDNEAPLSRPQLVASFDHAAGGAISIDGPEKTKAPLVIQSLKNRNWREESRRKKGKNLLPAEVQAARSGQVLAGLDPEVNDAQPREFGLSFAQTTVEKKEGDVAMMDVQIASSGTDAPTSIDEEALEALTGNAPRKSTLVLPGQSASSETSEFLNAHSPMNEDESFRFDVASRPDSAKLEDYVAVPVEEFGAALLRGMGWKEGEVIGKRKGVVSKARVVERRPALLGIGAKEVPAGVGEELGAWGKVSKGKRKTEKAYNPVLLRNSKTGELLTEEELEAKKESRRKEEVEWRERRDRNLAADETRKSERAYFETGKRHREGRHDSKDARSRSAERSRRGSSRRERSRSTDRSRGSRNRDRHQDDYDYAKRRERKEREHRSRDSRKDDRAGADTERRGYGHREEYDDSRRRRRQEVF